MVMKHLLLLLPVPLKAGTCAVHGGAGDAAAAWHQRGAQDLPSCALSSAPSAIPAAFANVVPKAGGGEVEEKVQARPVLN